MDVRRVTDGFSVSPQVEPEDFADLARLGFRHVVNNRPDGEASGQPTSAAAEAAASAAGLSYVHAPFAGQPTAAAIETLREQLASATGPVIAYCRSGTRSITAWAVLQASSSRMDVETILQSARIAGYNLDGLKDYLRNLSRG
ncbi:MAG: TIGR01244 family phosphatase [Alphaproteobacteria bacterium]|nr:TIGR01244 family phosphatase [Alphaproteobacteria bacterium]